MIKIEKIKYNGWNHCIHMQNDYISLIATTDVGPRIIYCSSTMEDCNLFHQREGQQGLTNSNEWLIYGGHRLWTSPQVDYRPNQPDNGSVSYKQEDDSLTLYGPEEAATKVQKQFCITFAQDKPEITVIHRIYNRNLWPIRFAPWALTVMHDSGTIIFPVPQEDTHFMPNYAITFWPWTKPNDRRFTLGEKYIILRQDQADKHWFKIGYRNTEGWGAYLFKKYMFVKIYKPIPNKEYPDYGATFETFIDNEMIEFETLGPLRTVYPGDYTEHTEKWHLFNDIPIPQTEKEIEETITKRIHSIM
jgi:hypothetical protein